MINMSNGRESVSCWKMLEMLSNSWGCHSVAPFASVCMCVCVHWLFVNPCLGP